VGESVEIRPIGEDEFPEALAVSQAAFGEAATQEDIDSWFPSFPFARSLAAFDSGRMVAISAVFSMELTVPGEKAIPMGGLTWVATMPSHRRLGLFSRLLAEQFKDMTARGEQVSGLGASEGVSTAGSASDQRRTFSVSESNGPTRLCSLDGVLAGPLQDAGP